MKKGSAGDVALRVQVVLGEKTLSLDELGSIGKGTIIELDSMAGEPVELLAGGRRIARGEVVVIDENFGIRVTSIEEGVGS